MDILDGEMRVLEYTMDVFDGEIRFLEFTVDIFAGKIRLVQCTVEQLEILKSTKSWLSRGLVDLF